MVNVSSDKQNPFKFQPVILDRTKNVNKRNIIDKLPAINQTETLQKFFGASADHLFDPGKGKPINGYVGSIPLWYNRDEDYYIEETSKSRSFYQLQPSLVSKTEEGQLTNLLFYPDLINHLRFQGGIVNNHNRLFEQEYYTWCPPVDLDKLINFRQYAWVPFSKSSEDFAFEVTGPAVNYIADGSTTEYFLPGYNLDGNKKIQSYYDLNLITKSRVHVIVDSREIPSDNFTLSADKKRVIFSVPPATDAEIKIWVYSDFEKNVLECKNVDPDALGGFKISTGHRIKILDDRNSDFKPSEVFIVEGVGKSIFLIKEEENKFASDTPDYLVIERGSYNKNPWSLANRWFHVSVLSSKYSYDEINQMRATRPIIEYKRNLELYQYGTYRRTDVDFVVRDVEDVTAYLESNPTAAFLDGQRVEAVSSDLVSLNGREPTHAIRLLVVGTSNELMNNKVYALVNVQGSLKLFMETDGQNPSGDPVFGEIIAVNLGSFADQELRWNGLEWSVAQSKPGANTVPLFSLYDFEGNALDDFSVYPGSNFKGSPIFTYKIDETGFVSNDPVLNIPLVHDNKGQILFENYISTRKVTYLLSGHRTIISGFYFHKSVESDGRETLSNDWHKSDKKSRQYVVDRYIWDGQQRIFTISQEPDVEVADSLIVKIGRNQDNGSFEELLLEEDKDFVRNGKEILISRLKVNDIVEIHTFSNKPLSSDSAGFFEVPMNLKSNPNNKTLEDVSRGDIYKHISETIRNQNGFEGAEYAINNWRDTEQDPTKGATIIQNGASLLKVMLLSSESQLDIMTAIRFSESEYNRFKEKFHQKVYEYTQGNTLKLTDNVEKWITTVLDDINKGKTKQFPFYLSMMGRLFDTDPLTYIPPSPSYMGVYPLYNPERMSTQVLDENGQQVTVHYVKGHDGSWNLARNEMCAQVLYHLEQRIYNSVVANVRESERPIFDIKKYYSNSFVESSYSYDDFTRVMQPMFERWCVSKMLDYRTNNLFDQHDPWTWNWSSVKSFDGTKLPGHWRGIFEKYYGTQRPDLNPWEMLGFTSRPSWWENRYGEAPYTSDNLLLWEDIERGYIAEGPRQGVNYEFARPGLITTTWIENRFYPKGSVVILSDKFYKAKLDHTSEASNIESNAALTSTFWEEIYEEVNLVPVDEAGALRTPYDIGIALDMPMTQDARADWIWGDMGPVEQEWRRSSSYSFAVAQAGYLLKPAEFVELAWDTENIRYIDSGVYGKQWINNVSRDRSNENNVAIHGETDENGNLVSRVGVQQWISEYLISRGSNVTTMLGDKVRGLDVQLAYKVGGFTDESTLVAISDSFGRVPSDDVTVSLYRSPSVKEEVYSGVIIEWTNNGYKIFGYNSLSPRFTTLEEDPNGKRIRLGSSGQTSKIPTWRENTYYSINNVVEHNKLFYRCTRSHTSSSSFEDSYWTETNRPKYSDELGLVWFLENDKLNTTVEYDYGTVLESPQDVATFLSGYSRFLESRGWVFDSLAEDGVTEINWQKSLKEFITWSSQDREEGDILFLSPGSTTLKYKTDSGTIQPVEQIVNGLYSIIDQLGRPIFVEDTMVSRFDDEITVTSTSSGSGIYCLRLHVSEVEHAIVLNNKTIFNDVLYSPLLNVHQLRVRLQGFKTMSWKGRMDAPGFIVTDTTLIPNFEKAADDFRYFFDIENNENKKMQDRARANFGYEEKEYLNNLLLSPTNQFEFYQGMIQQKGTPTAMGRLLRSNFIRHNKNISLFEEWAFRVGDYGGSDINHNLDIVINASEFKHNPQLVTFNVDNRGLEGDSKRDTPNIEGAINIVDEFSSSDYSLDYRWVWRPYGTDVKWVQRDYDDVSNKNLVAGHVNVDEVDWTVLNKNELDRLVSLQLSSETNSFVKSGDRAWVYGIGEDEWMTYKFFDTGYEIQDIKSSEYEHQGSLIVLNKYVKTSPLQSKIVSCESIRNRDLNFDEFYISLPNNPVYRKTKLDSGKLVEELIVTEGDEALNGNIYTPIFRNVVDITVDGSSGLTHIVNLHNEAGQAIKSITVEVVEPYASGSTLKVGTNREEDAFVKAHKDEVVYPPLDSDSEYVTVAQREFFEVNEGDTVVPIELVRVGPTLDACGATTASVFYRFEGETTWRSVCDRWPSPPPLDDHGNPILCKDNKIVFERPQHLEEGDYSHYIQTIHVPIKSHESQQVIELKVVTNDDPSTEKQTSIAVVKPSSGWSNFVDLTVKGKKTFGNNFPDLYPYCVRDNDLEMIASLESKGSSGKLKITVEYFYTKGFELGEIVEGKVVRADTDVDVLTGKINQWVPTKFSEEVVNDELFNSDDILEFVQGDNWWTKFYGSTTNIREKNRRVDSSLIDNAGIYNARDNSLILVLQVYDPLKGYIPGIADRELHYKGSSDPALYNSNPYSDEKEVWGSEQVGRLWWDQSTVRYLDYELDDEDPTKSALYRWRNWGRIAPGTSVDIYEWTRSPVPPTDWASYVADNANISSDVMFNKPTGQAKLQDDGEGKFVTRIEWNDELQRDETVYYFWVKNKTTVPPINERHLSARQVSSIIVNPSANDIPYISIIDSNKIIVSGIKQFLNDGETILKVKWRDSSEVEVPHHKQWIILREKDDRNIIPDSLWNKMRNSLVGWDSFVPSSMLAEQFNVGDNELYLVNGSDFSSSGELVIRGNIIRYENKEHNRFYNLTTSATTGFAPLDPVEQKTPVAKQVPDIRMPKLQQLGNLVRPRQSWFPVDKDGRANRHARKVFFDCLNNILSEEPYMDLWYDLMKVLDQGEALPNPDLYVATADSISDMKLMINRGINPIQEGDRVLIPNTEELHGFWTLWKLVDEYGEKTFILDDFQKWRLREGEFWNKKDWFAKGYSRNSSPHYIFNSLSDKERFGPINYTLLNGTLVQINNLNGEDGRWFWDVVTETQSNRVAIKDGTFEFSSAFFSEESLRFDPEVIREIKNLGVTADNVGNILGDLVLYRDGTMEMQVLIDAFRKQFLSEPQRNELFFAMVREALKHPGTDWVFKTSFLYLGGYSEELRQSPVVTSDQVHNVISYLEEVKPYHVKIREYVRRLSYGPDVANLVVTDFDKPLYLDNSTGKPVYTTLQPGKPTDNLIMSTTRPWKDWFENYRKENYDIDKWDENWNPVRRTKIQVAFDRIGCEVIQGWDTYPWDPAVILYSQSVVESESLSVLCEKYRNRSYPNGQKPYVDKTVETIFDRNMLVRDGTIGPSNSGSIVTVLEDLSRWMWTGKDWIRFEAIGWDMKAPNGSVDRIDQFYQPSYGMTRRDDPGIISGCDFGGTTLSSRFQDGGWDIFEWGSTGWGSEFQELVGYDVGTLNGNTTATLGENDYDILVTGNANNNPYGTDNDDSTNNVGHLKGMRSTFARPNTDNNRPEELVPISPVDSLVITVKNNDETADKTERRYFQNFTGGWEDVKTTEMNMNAVEWNTKERTITIQGSGAMTLHDPYNPSKEFMDKVKLSKSYFSDSPNTMNVNEEKVFDLKDLKEIPLGLVGKSNAMVVLENSEQPEYRILAEIISSSQVEGSSDSLWSGSLTVRAVSFIGNAPANPSASIDKWNILPIDNYNIRGVAWFGTARVSYRTIEKIDETTYKLIDAFVSASSLSGINVDEVNNKVSFVDTTLYDGLDMHKNI